MTMPQLAEPAVAKSDWKQQLVCPACRGELEHCPGECRCRNECCAQVFPVSDGVPVLINDDESVFTCAEVVAGARGGGNSPLRERLRQALGPWVPSLSNNLAAEQNYRELRACLLAATARPRVLVVGSRTLGAGMEALAAHPAIELVESDVTLGERPAVVFDAHHIPFRDGTFDGVIVQAVLEHVADPAQCVAEIHRVLKPAGYVYAETPFMQQVHEGAFDFTRFTHLGHRRLFRDFEEVDSGVCCGPGMALAWSWKYFLTSFSDARAIRGLAHAVARCTGFFLKYLDRFLIHRPGAYDAASGCYFLGRRSERRLSDRELIGLYRGAKRAA